VIIFDKSTDIARSQNMTATAHDKKTIIGVCRERKKRRGNWEALYEHLRTYELS